MAFSSFLASVSLRKRKKTESITGLSELTAASVAVFALPEDADAEKCLPVVLNRWNVVEAR